MTIELDTTLAQAEVLFLSFAQLVADIDRRKAEEDINGRDAQTLRQRGTTNEEALATVSMPTLSENLRDLLKAGR